MATSKKDPVIASRDKAPRMSPNLRPSSSESSVYGYSAVPSSPDRKFGSSSPSVPAPGSLDVKRPLLSSAGRSVSSRTMASKPQPFPGAASKPTLSRAKSDKLGTTSQRPPVLSVPSSNSFKGMSKTASKALPSTLQRSKLSPRHCTDTSKAAASPKLSSQRVVSSPGSARGGRVQSVSSARSPGAAAKKKLDAPNCSTVSSKAKGVSQKAMGPSAPRKEKEEDPSIKLTESIEEHLHEQLPDPVDLTSMDIDVPDQHDHPEQQIKNEEDLKGCFFEENQTVGGIELHNRGQDANDGVTTIDESGLLDKDDINGSVDRTVPSPSRTEGAQLWRKDDPRSNDVIEETKSKLLEERKSRVKALVGAFETVMSFKE